MWVDLGAECRGAGAPVHVAALGQCLEIANLIVHGRVRHSRTIQSYRLRDRLVDLARHSVQKPQVNQQCGADHDREDGQ